MSSNWQLIWGIQVEINHKKLYRLYREERHGFLYESLEARGTRGRGVGEGEEEEGESRLHNAIAA